MKHFVFIAAALAMPFVSARAQSTTPVVLESNPSQKQIEAAIYEYWMSVQSLDARRYMNNFAPNGTLEDPVGTPAIQGASTIGAFFANGFPAYGIGRVTPRVKDMFVGVGLSTEVAVRWELTGYTRTGKQFTLQGIGLFKFRPIQPGARLQLESVREFYDPIQLVSQLQ